MHSIQRRRIFFSLLEAIVRETLHRTICGIDRVRVFLGRNWVSREEDSAQWIDFPAWLVRSRRSKKSIILRLMLSWKSSDCRAPLCCWTTPQMGFLNFLQLRQHQVEFITATLSHSLGAAATAATKLDPPANGDGAWNEGKLEHNTQEAG